MKAGPVAGGAVPRLGIPGIRFSDGPRGVVIGRCTAFPVTIMRAATWDPALEEPRTGTWSRRTGTWRMLVAPHSPGTFEDAATLFDRQYLDLG